VIEIEITPEMIARAQTKSQAMGSLNNSIRNGRGNLCGFLGEICVETLLGAQENNTYQFDLVWNGVELEVKTKDRTVKPCAEFDASVANYNARQTADCYVFVSLLRNKSSGQYTHGYVMGLMPKTEYIQRARFMRKGDIDPSNGWEVSADCYNLPYGDLYHF
jgi:hypothetical protein